MRTQVVPLLIRIRHGSQQFPQAVLDFSEMGVRSKWKEEAESGRRKVLESFEWVIGEIGCVGLILHELVVSTDKIKGRT